MPTETDCKRLIFKVAISLGVSPNLIATRLLDASDKQLMLDGEIDETVLDCGVRSWIEAGCPDYVSGCTVGLDWKPYDNLKARCAGKPIC